MLYLTGSETITNLKHYVANGGVLYATYMLGTVDSNDLCYLGGIPANELKEVFGVVSEEIDTLYPDERQHAMIGQTEHELQDYCEVVHPVGAEVLAVYSDGYYQGTPAVTANHYGTGTAVYQACRDCGSLKEEVLSHLIREHHVMSAVDTENALPHGVTAHSRTDGVHTYVFVENYSDQAAAPVKFRGEMLDLLSSTVTDTCNLGPYGFGIFRTE